jgi:hypothetical protein
LSELTNGRACLTHTRNTGEGHGRLSTDLPTTFLISSYGGYPVGIRGIWRLEQDHETSQDGYFFPFPPMHFLWITIKHIYHSLVRKPRPWWPSTDPGPCARIPLARTGKPIDLCELPDFSRAAPPGICPPGLQHPSDQAYELLIGDMLGQDIQGGSARQGVKEPS